MTAQEIQKLVDKSEITTISALSMSSRTNEPKCRKELEKWHKVSISEWFFYAKDEEVGAALAKMVESGTLTNITKYRYDNGTYRKVALAKLADDYEPFSIGKRMFYVKNEE